MAGWLARWMGGWRYGHKAGNDLIFINFDRMNGNGDFCRTPPQTTYVYTCMDIRPPPAGRQPTDTTTTTCPIIMHSYYYLLLIAVCNRTYYGDIGRTYSLRVPPPQWTRLPFLCHLTFTASGHEQGDLVQVSPSQFIWHFND